MFEAAIFYYSYYSLLGGTDVKAAYIHSFITTNFLIFCIWPSHFASDGANVLWTRSLLDALADFDSSATANWFVIDRRHGNGVVAKFESNAMFVFHTVNAYEVASKQDRVDIVCDVMQYRNMDVLEKFYYENMISTASGAGNPINPAFKKPHHYVYGICDRGKSCFLDGLVKVDMETRTSKLWSKKSHTPGEPIFVGNPEKAGEDDGAVLSVVLDGESGRSYLLVLDAKTWVEVGRAEAPGAVGLGFHGVHVKL
ncbi:carotenoid oxygenase [Mycena rosella]|uniref:Carotenoid oxygenase n=1 Tax=Mycena rosella TaxID=1033263 RepID=A0AAD7GHZ6_MYCRO|nr:carotenoid oxygenase [Mycena rosella]